MYAPLPLPTPTLELLSDLRRVGRFLDHAADVAPTDEKHHHARELAIKQWAAVDRVEELARALEDVSGARLAPTARES